MALSDDLVRIAEAAAALGAVEGVLAAEPARNLRRYLVAFAGDPRPWLVLDDEARPVERREDVRDTASIVAVCELAEEVAGGGDLESLRARLAQLRIVESPPGIAEAEEAALELERVIGAPPRVASPAFLDELGAATLALERALGDISSPFGQALRAGAATIEQFVQDVERGYLVPLR
jgi:hypothetical protein